ncbi:proteasome assembly chaperone 2 [Maniola hyperantus]|uniref:proteasome assembly chaperone 2 n=1 Tax=Aphantopus hyperantus TaxID=2795564 RepID=UPI001568F93B|nr:proteasome assembly chaperone 2 [Maniola hyperantus]
MGETNIWKFIDDISLVEYTLIVPSVAVGNVGQLSCDLLISSLKMVKIASIYSPAVIPVIGYDPYDLKSSSLSTTCEVYKSVSRKILVLQLRAPLVHKYANSFLKDVVNTFMDKQIKDILILTSSFAHEKKHILSSPFRFVASEGNPHTENLIKANLVEHEENTGELKIFGGGFASLLYKISLENGLPCLLLYKYCSEGDNIPDAYDMVHNLAKLLPIFTEDKDLLSQLQQPVSWTLLFGRPPPQDIY